MLLKGNALGAGKPFALSAAKTALPTLAYVTFAERSRIGSKRERA